jgi:hypothetical protein
MFSGGFFRGVFRLFHPARLRLAQVAFLFLPKNCQLPFHALYGLVQGFHRFVHSSRLLLAM